MLLTRAAHHLLMHEASASPRQAMMTISNARDHLRSAGVDNRVKKKIGSIHGQERNIEWIAEKDRGEIEGRLHARIMSKGETMNWRIDDDTISITGLPSSTLISYRARLKHAAFPATDLVSIAYLSGRNVFDMNASEDGAIFVLDGSYRDSAILEYPQTMGEWRNAGSAYAKGLPDTRQDRDSTT